MLRISTGTEFFQLSRSFFLILATTQCRILRWAVENGNHGKVTSVEVAAAGGCPNLPTIQSGFGIADTAVYVGFTYTRIEQGKVFPCG